MTDTLRPRVISSYDWWQALVVAGVFRDDEMIRRVVIDAEAGGTVIIHVERFGDDRLLEVARTLEGVEIREVDRPRAGQETKEE